MKRVIVSIGCFTVEEIQGSRFGQDGSVLWYFDPRSAVVEKFIETFKDNPDIHIFQKAVSHYTGTGYLYLDGGASSMIQNRVSPKVEVEVISLADVIKEIEDKCDSDSRKILFMNCEGSEVSIVLCTSLEILKKFERIFIEFHPKLYPENMMQKCVDKLSSSFNYSVSYGSVSKFPKYEFRLKSQCKIE